MATSLDLILTALQNGVSGINNLAQTMNSIFPHTTASSTSVTAGTITFTSSEAAGFLIVQTSSGATVKIAYYNQ
jgi:hypothetical protein